MEAGKGVMHSVTQHMGVCSYVTRYLEYKFGYASFEVPRILRRRHNTFHLVPLWIILEKFLELCWSMLTCCAGKKTKNHVIPAAGTWLVRTGVVISRIG